MRRVKRSTLTAFLFGLGLASASTVGAIGVLYAVAPPSPDADAFGFARVARAPHETRTDALPANVQIGTSDDVAAAQARVARQTADFDAQRVLTRSIQQELQRVGCYSGSLDGQWSESTRRSMGAFTQSLNAKLPINAPDYILLTMLQGQRGVACGPVKSNDAPTTTARANEKPRVRERAAERTETSALPSAKWPEAKVAVQEQQKREVVPEFRTSVVTATEAADASLPFQPMIVQPSVSLPSALPPLPGRMAVGAPVQDPIGKPNTDSAEPLAVAPQPPAAAKKARAATRDPSREIPRPVREYRDYRPVVTYSSPSQARRTSPFASLSRNAP